VGRKINILVADDEPVNLSIIVRLLEGEGYNVTTVENGQQAFIKVREQIPDLVILDVMMPILDGLQTLKLIKDNKAIRNIPVIILSALNDTDAKVKAFNLGAKDYITKPFKLLELLARVKAHLPPTEAVTLIEHSQPIPPFPRPNKRDPYRLTGNVLSGRYSLTAYAGGGGMGAVYQAIDTELKRSVAVKILKPDVVERSPEYAELFEREAKNAQRLEHPHIVKIFDSGKDDDLSYMVMEWVEGRSVEDVLTEGQLPLVRLTNIFGQICSAVAFAHERGIIHLDLKPGNILLVDHLESDDLVKVIDFGLSRVITKESGTTVTKFRGTHQFCAPEQFGGKVSHRSDIYSLGATLYYLLTGVIPFGNSYINAKIHPNLELPEIPSVVRQRNLPPALDIVIRKALNKNPASRQQSASQLFYEFSIAMRCPETADTTDSVYVKLKEIIVDELGVDENRVVPTATITEALGADGSDLVEIILRVKEGFSIDISDDEMMAIRTVNDAYHLVKSKDTATVGNTEGKRAEEVTKYSSLCVRRDEQGGFVEADLSGRSSPQGRVKREADDKGRTITRRDWNNPQVACSLLSNISGLQTGGYKSTGVEDGFFCCSPYKDLDKDSPLPNNIAYYAEGDAEGVNRLKLVLNVNNSEKAEAAHRALMTYSNELACKALGEELRPKMQDAILAGRPFAYKVGELFVELKVEAWVTERGYEMKFIITQPINTSRPIKAIESQEETKPISSTNFIESDSKIDSPARLPTSNLDYEPDETAISILVFLAKPQHQTVYAVEIGNSLGLPQTLVKSYLDKLAKADYVLITRDSHTNSDVCTITPKCKKFLDRPAHTIPHPSGHDELDSPKIQTLQLLADENYPPHVDSLSVALGIDQVRLKEHLDVLIERGWVTANEFDEWHAAKFRLTRKARQFLINNDLIKLK